MAAVCIAAPRSGSGKTLLTCGLIRSFMNRKLKVQSFKTGPDYIDPLFHDTVLADGNEGSAETGGCENLDTYLADYETVRDIYAKCSSGADISVIEGVMGLYDGVGGIKRQGSTYDVASCLNVPIILVVDARGASGSLIAEIRGFTCYDEAGLISGVILNRCSKTVYETLSSVIRDELNIKALGYLPVLKDIKIESRYLGLTLPEEIVDIKLQIQKLAGYINDTVDIDGIIEISSSKG
ncbi:MAG: AAA family ATPase [Lachnospiraceae bacterium]|nr:AAA family ATPase [Lachnospiraceae bacterium]MBQ9606518.1 AAA family ATPase [Lachnospiraceae bacterium]MBR1523546.1 AAA family ATPase [Lachnospiraceae bacterium]